MGLGRVVVLVLMALQFQVQSNGLIEEPSYSRHFIQKRFEDDKPNPKFQLNDYQVQENDGTLVDLVCVIGGGDDRLVSVFSARGDPQSCARFPCPPATEGEDFVPISKLEFIIKPRDTVCFNITLIDDNRLEGREFFLLAVEDLRWGEIIDTTVITINDNDDPSLSPASQTVAENAGTVPICIQGGIDTVPVIMQLQDTSSASDQLDFTFVDNGEVVLDPGEMSCFSFNIVDDDLNENVEDIRVIFTQGNGTNATFVLEGVIRILDNDNSAAFEKSLFIGREGAGSVEVCVTFRAAPSTTVTAHITSSDGTAKDFSDYIYYESRFNISGGEKVCHDIQLLNDSTPETAELFQIWITSSNSEFGSTRALVKIYDDDVLDFDSPNRRYFTEEIPSFLPVCVRLLSGSNNDSVHGYIYTQPRSAKVNSDFYYLGESFLLNHTSERCFYIAILGDDVPEVEEELRVVLLTISDGFIIRTVIATVVIRDDDATPCEDLTPPANGRISVSNGNIPGSKALYGCNSGFTLQGSFRRKCRVDGTWTGTIPTCEAGGVTG